MEEAHSVIEPTIAKGSLVLVTGANGYIASHCVDQLLAAGYRVRGTVRSLGKLTHRKPPRFSTRADGETEKADWLYKIFDKKYGKGKFEAVTVPDMAADDAFNDSVRGVDGICHVSSVMTFSSDPDEVIPPAVKGTLNVLTAATREASVKSVVYTSSSCAALMPEVDRHIKVTKDTWDDRAIQEAATRPDSFNVYAASKTEAERAFWKAVESTKPPFQTCAVLPNANFGPILDPERLDSSSTGSNLIKAFFRTGKISMSSQWFVDVRDTARLHVIALIDQTCNGQRVFAFAEPFNSNSILRILKKQNPDKEYPEEEEGQGMDLSEIPNHDAAALLQKHYGKEFTMLEESIRDATEGLKR